MRKKLEVVKIQKKGLDFNEAPIFGDNLDNFNLVSNIGLNHVGFKDCPYYHLYLVSDEEIKEGDWYIVDNIRVKECRKAIIDRGTVKGIKKVIATTDKSLTQKLLTLSPSPRYEYLLPQIPESFIKAYVEANGEIDEVMVEYKTQEMRDHAMIPIQIETNILKTRDDNTVIIHEHLFKGIWNDINPDDFKAEKTYSREDLVVELHSIVNDALCGAKRVRSRDSNSCAKFVNEWIKENL